jgi:hypothetical protein
MTYTYIFKEKESVNMKKRRSENYRKCCDQSQDFAELEERKEEED